MFRSYGDSRPTIREAWPGLRSRSTLRVSWGHLCKRALQVFYFFRECTLTQISLEICSVSKSRIETSPEPGLLRIVTTEMPLRHIKRKKWAHHIGVPVRAKNASETKFGPVRAIPKGPLRGQYIPKGIRVKAAAPQHPAQPGFGLDAAPLWDSPRVRGLLDKAVRPGFPSTSTAGTP